MKLSFIVPAMMNGKPIVCLQIPDVNAQLQKWSSAVVFYVVDENPTIKYLNMFIEKHWNCMDKTDIFLHEEGYLIISFESVNERDRILSSGLYCLANPPTILKPWSAEFCFKEEV